MAFISVILFVHLTLLISKAELICDEEYTCYEDPDQDIVWVATRDAITFGTSCKSICENALLNNDGIFHSCDNDIPIFHDIESFSNISAGLNFTCIEGIYSTLCSH